MLYSIGDSHSLYTFNNIPNLIPVHIGPITLKRVGYMEDDCLSNAIKKLNPSPSDTFILCFGEIDVRCWVKIYLNRRKDNDLSKLLQDWVDKYLIKAEFIKNNLNVKIAVMSVPPPAYFENANSNPSYPVAGSNEERSLYTKKINEILQLECPKYNLTFVDVYSSYKDEYGLLPVNVSDGTVHILNSIMAHNLLVSLGLLPS